MNIEEMEYSVLERLPDYGERILCFGHRTFCCKDDMREEAEWHEVIFEFFLSSYRLKKDIPEDPEESMLEQYKAREIWRVENSEDHVIGVKKWKKIKK